MAFLGIDIGTSGTKALVLSRHGHVLSAAESAHQLLTPKPGWAEQDPENWWQAVKLATRAALKKARIKGQDIRAIGLSGQMHGSVFLGQDVKPIRPALLWNDQRTSEQCQQIETIAGGRSALIERVGNPALTGFTAPKILWFMQNEPAKFEKCRHVLLPKDYIRLMMTGEYASEVSDASGTLLLNVRQRAWHTDFIRQLGLDPALMPRVVESHEITGSLTKKAAEELGLPEGAPVVGGAGDQAAGAIGTGVVLPGLVSSSMGTSGVIFAASAEPQTDPQGRVHTMCHAIPNTWCVFGCMLSAGGSLQWLRNVLFKDQLEKVKDAGQVYPTMDAEAETIPAGSENLLFLPYLTGERCPHADPDARGTFIGITPRHTRGHMIRAVMEGITFGMREQIMIFREMGIPIQQVRAQGGGARSNLWRQMQSDMYQAPVVTINAAEGAALGVAILAGVGAGEWKDVPTACKAIIRIKQKHKPAKKAAAFYEHHYAKYAMLYPALKDAFKKML